MSLAWGWNEPWYGTTRRQYAMATVSAQLGSDTVQVSWSLPASNTYVEWWAWWGHVIGFAPLTMVQINVYVNPAPWLPLSWGVDDAAGQKQVWWASSSGSADVTVFWVPGYFDWDNPYTWPWGSFDSDDKIVVVVTPFYGWNLMPQPAGTITLPM